MWVYCPVKHTMGGMVCNMFITLETTGSVPTPMEVMNALAIVDILEMELHA